MIEVNGITILGQVQEAHDIQKLVKQEKKWLKQARPDVLKRYRNHEKAFRSLSQHMLSSEISAHIIRRNKAIVGLGTVVKSMTLRHSTEGIVVSGREIDYWTQADVSDHDHVEIAAQLAGWNDYEGTVLGLLTRAETERARGIPLYMEPIGSPASMEIPREQDTYGISLIPELQLYMIDI